MSASDKKVSIVVGDIGSAKELIPAAKILTSRGVDVQWFVDPAGKGCKVLDSHQILYHTRTEAIGSNVGNLILIGTSATAVSEQIVWTIIGQDMSIPVIWYEDLWGTGELPVTRCVDPNVILCISQTAADIARRVRPHMNALVVGKPSFENIKHIDVAATRQLVRSRLKVHHDNFMVVYWGGGDTARVRHHIRAINTYAGLYGLAFVPRLHPKMPDLEEIVTMVNMSRFRVCWADQEIPEELNCAADAVIGEWGSTQTYAAALVGTRPLLVMWPDDKLKRLDCGFDNGIPPLVSTLVGHELLSPSDLLSVLSFTAGRCDSTRQNIASAAHHWFGDACQPGAAERIADAVMSYL